MAAVITIRVRLGGTRGSDRHDQPHPAGAVRGVARGGRRDGPAAEGRFRRGPPSAGHPPAGGVGGADAGGEARDPADRDRRSGPRVRGDGHLARPVRRLVPAGARRRLRPRPHPALRAAARADPRLVRLNPARRRRTWEDGGFIGGGLIFVRRDAVRGLTTAATIWLVAAVGMACGGGLPVLAVTATLGRIVVALDYPRLSHAIAVRRRDPPVLRLSYADGFGVLRAALGVCTDRGFAVNDIDVTREGLDDAGDRIAAVTLQLAGRGDLGSLAGKLAELPGVRTAHTGPR